MPIIAVASLREDSRSRKRRLQLATLLTVAASGWWLLRDRAVKPDAVSPAAAPANRISEESRATLRQEEASGAGVDASAISAAEARHLGEIVLALMRDYERRREADDPVGADVARLRFLDLLDDETAPQLVRTLPREFLESFFGDLALRHWAGRDRAAAAAWMAAHPANHAVPAAALAHAWVTQDAAGLHVYLDSLPTGEWRHLVAKAAGEEALVAGRVDETLALLGKIHGSDARRDELREWAVTKWAMSAPDKAMAWAASFAGSRPAEAERLLAAVAIGHANNSPAEAAAWLQTRTSDAAVQAPAFAAIARLWTVRDPEAAARWVDTLPAGALRDGAERGLLAVAAPSNAGD